MNKPIILSLFIILLFCFFSSGCVSNNEEELYGIQICDTTNITWDSKISEIFVNNCVQCHNAELHYRDIRHDTYTEELKVIQSGRLRGAINHLSGYVPMPYEQGKLPACELQLINLWLDNGFPEK